MCWAAGCCEAEVQRISLNIADFPGYSGEATWWNEWHHFAFVKNGDRIRVSVQNRRIDLLVDEAELAERRKTMPVTPFEAQRGYARMYRREVLLADEGCDFDSLRSEPERA